MAKLEIKQIEDKYFIFQGRSIIGKFNSIETAEGTLEILKKLKKEEKQ